MKLHRRNICVLGYKATEAVGWGIARYTWWLLEYLKRCERLRVDFVAQGFVPKNVLIRNLKKLVFFIKVCGVKADLYHAVTPILGVPLALTDKSPTVVTLHDLLHFYPGYGSSALKLNFMYHSYVFSKFDAIIATAEYWKQDIARRFSISSRKIHVVYNGVDVKRFKPVHGLRDKHMKKILYVGSPTTLRGLHILIQAFSIVSRKLRNAEFLIGGRIDRNYILELSNKFGVDVKSLGFIPEEKLPKLYSSMHVFVNPTTDEYSLMLLEAMACGTPVVARDIFEMREYLGDAAMLVKSERADDLADAIIGLLSDDELWFKLSQRGIERSSIFDWRKTAENTYKVYTKYL